MMLTLVSPGRGEFTFYQSLSIMIYRGIQILLKQICRGLLQTDIFISNIKRSCLFYLFFLPFSAYFLSWQITKPVQVATCILTHPSHYAVSETILRVLTTIVDTILLQSQPQCSMLSPPNTSQGILSTAQQKQNKNFQISIF